jgi:hypothetical protein
MTTTQPELTNEITHELIDILDARDWDLLEDFIARRGYDENKTELPQ